MDNTYVIRYNVFDVVGNWQGGVCDTTDCVAQAAWSSGLCMCLALNSTLSATFPDDGSGIIAKCLEALLSMSYCFRFLNPTDTLSTGVLMFQLNLICSDSTSTTLDVNEFVY